MMALTTTFSTGTSSKLIHVSIYKTFLGSPLWSGSLGKDATVDDLNSVLNDLGYYDPDGSIYVEGNVVLGSDEPCRKIYQGAWLLILPARAKPPTIDDRLAESKHSYQPTSSLASLHTSPPDPDCLLPHIGLCNKCSIGDAYGWTNDDGTFTCERCRQCAEGNGSVDSHAARFSSLDLCSLD
jgi:hypothetical protein